jgi:hypothetical protein
VFFQIEIVEERFGRRLCRHGHQVQREDPGPGMIKKVRISVFFFAHNVDDEMKTNIKNLDLSVAIDGTTNA